MSTKSFLLWLWLDKDVEFSTIDSSWCRIVTPKQGMDDLYFVWKSKNAKNRSWKEDIYERNYFFIDYDVRAEHYTKTKNVLSDWEVMDYMMQVVDKIHNHPILWQWRYVVFSWNGFHIYYTTDSRDFDSNAYEEWVQSIYEMSDKFLDDPILITDKSCRTINRISRLPWSYNTKRVSKYWLKKEDLECQVVFHEDRHCDAFISFHEKLQQSKETMEIKKAKNVVSREMQKDNVYEAICEIDIRDIVCDHLWVQMQKDNINFKSNNDGMNMWMFVSENLLVNTWSKHIMSDKPWYNTFSFVKHEITKDDKETFLWFRRKYKHIDDLYDKIQVKTEESDKPQIDNPMDYTISFGDLIRQARDSRQAMKKSDLCSYWSLIDEYCEGIAPWELVLIWADTGVGKSEIAYNIAIENAIRWKKVLLFSLEWSLEEIAYRYIQREMSKTKKIETKKYRFDWEQYRLEENKVVQELEQKLANNLFVFNKKAKTNLPFIKEMIIKTKDKVDMIVLDHLHYISLETANENREVWEIMREIKLITDITKKPVVLVSHLRKRDRSKEPTDQDFHWSSNIPKEATSILLLCKDNDREDIVKEYISPTKIILAKSRAWLWKIVMLADYDMRKKEYTSITLDKYESTNLYLK